MQGQVSVGHSQPALGLACHKWWMPAPLPCVEQGEQASCPTTRAFTQQRGNLRVTPAVRVTSRSTCVKTNTEMENQGQDSLQNTPGRSSDVDVSVTGPSTPL